MVTRFSVVVPLYNKSQYIKKTITSILNQSFTNFEIIVVDDGSTDNVGLILQDIIDPRLIVIKQENAGVSVARNNGVKASAGEFIAFIDADDWWLTWHLQELDFLINNFPYLGLYSVGHSIYENGRNIRPAGIVNENFFGVVENFLEIFGNGLSLINSSTACVRRISFENAGGFPENINCGEDVYLWIKVALAEGMAHSGRICATYNKDAIIPNKPLRFYEIPYYLTYLDLLIRDHRFQYKIRRAAKRLLFKAIIIQAASYSYRDDKVPFAKLNKLYLTQESYLLKITIFIIRYSPKTILLISQKFRRKIGKYLCLLSAK
jgi:glycosyltransferase involved in cell wall biosynthesis